MDSGTTPRGGGLHLPLYKRLNKFPSKTCFLEKGARTKNEREKVKSVVGARQEGAQKICLLLTFDREILGGFLKAFFLTARHKFNSSFRPSFDQHGTSLCSIFEMENFAKFFLVDSKMENGRSSRLTSRLGSKDPVPDLRHVLPTWILRFALSRNVSRKEKKKKRSIMNEQFAISWLIRFASLLTSFLFNRKLFYFFYKSPDNPNRTIFPM